MSSIEKISEVIAYKIAANLSMDNDQEEVLAYGAFALIQTIISILSVAIFGIIFNVLIESLFISFAAAILRKFSGGVHATSPMNCALIGMIIFGGLALLVKYCVMNIGFLYLAVAMFIAFVFAFYVMHKYSPVGCANKPLKNENTRKRLKRQSLIFVLSLLIANIILTTIYLKTKQIHLLSIAACISAGVAWQSITMVSLGHKIIDRLDKLLRGTNNLIRRTNL